MKPAWDQLGDEYAGSPSVLIGDVDCTADGQSLCEKAGVQGYPTIKYYTNGDTEEGEPYNGGRDLGDLRKHVEDELETRCSVGDPTSGGGCTEQQIGYIEKMAGRGAGEQRKQLDRLEGMRDQTMAASNRRWLMQRIGVLRQFLDGSSGSEDEL